ncbi:AAA family ATPase [Paenibacillus sp. FSL R10-2734]|uniref:AAA family ATPase n=1 Tax=Paenibacillus sp. FSL R10-2734 TaxID=2954691 RepID=UPI0030DD4DE3
MRIRIIGACGSGKSYIARELSEKFGVDYYETDNLVWDRSGENLRYSVEARDAQLEEILDKPSWILEGAHYKWGQESFKRADLIVILNPNKVIRDLRVITRFIKTRLGFEQANYKQSFKNLYVMIFEWNRGYDQEAIHRIIELTNNFSDRRVILKDNKELETIIEERIIRMNE